VGRIGWKREDDSIALGALPPNPRNLSLSGQNGCFDSTTMEALERRIGLRRNATRAPIQAPEWQSGFGRPNFLSPAVKAVKRVRDIRALT
jgi:hypothetical protein